MNSGARKQRQLLNRNRESVRAIETEKSKGRKRTLLAEISDRSKLTVFSQEELIK
jgi:hypothetical protein